MWTGSAAWDRIEAPEVTTTVLKLLGSPSLAASNAAAGQPQPGVKGLALLAYLTLERGSHTREELAALLWGESSEAAARGSLRQVLLLIRQNLGDVLRVDRQTVELVTPPACDVTHFLETVKRDPVDAVKVDVSRFLSGFSLRDAPAFDDWAERKRRELTQVFREAVRELAAASMKKSRWREAAGWAERWLTSDPLSDEATRLLIEALYLGGDRAASLARYQDYRERLARELSSEPSAALRSLAQRIESDVRTLEPEAPADAPAPAPAFESPLVGRDAQWNVLVDVWKAATRGTARVALVEGASGVGKTRLAEEFVRWTSIEGGTAARGRCFDAAGVPYAPIAEALRALLDAPGLGGTGPEWLAEATRLLPELRRRFPSLPEPGIPDDAAARWRLLEAVAQLILAVAAERPTVIWIDDAHWADAESCGAFQFLARRLANEPVVLLLTMTPGELVAEAPAIELFQSLRFEPHAVSIPLSPLTEAEVWQLIHEMGRIKAPGGGRRFAQKVFELSQGNASYAIELVKTLFAAGVFGATPLSLEWVAWAPASADEYHPLQLPRTVRDSVARRIAKLERPLDEIIATVAVAGQAVGSDLVASVHHLSRLQATGMLTALARRELVVEEHGRFRCAHRVIQDVARQELTPATRLELHRALALALVAVTSEDERGEIAGRIASHAGQGGEPGLAHRYSIAASEAAATRYAFDEALAWLELAAVTARTAGERDEVSRRSTRLLETTGWQHRTGPGRRPGTPAWGIRREDLDLRIIDQP